MKRAPRYGHLSHTILFIKLAAPLDDRDLPRLPKNNGTSLWGPSSNWDEVVEQGVAPCNAKIQSMLQRRETLPTDYRLHKLSANLLTRWPNFLSIWNTPIWHEPVEGSTLVWIRLCTWPFFPTKRAQSINNNYEWYCVRICIKPRQWEFGTRWIQKSC